MVPLATVMAGPALTLTVATAVFPVQPCALVPVTEYEVVVVGETVKLLPVIE